MNRASSALTLIATLFCARKLQMVAQHIQHRHTTIQYEFDIFSIDLEPDWNLGVDPSRGLIILPRCFSLSEQGLRTEAGECDAAGDCLSPGDFLHLLAPLLRPRLAQRLIHGNDERVEAAAKPACH
jgi:hypothetical protein